MRPCGVSVPTTLASDVVLCPTKKKQKAVSRKYRALIYRVVRMNKEAGEVNVYKHRIGEDEPRRFTFDMVYDET